MSRSLILALLFLLPSIPAFAQQAATGFALPDHPAAWINSPPISKENLQGKGVFLWFYEEGCPRCREKWPEMMNMAKKYEGQPVVFIAINSGNPRPAVEQYAREVRLTWPVIVDPLRQLEKAAGFQNEISLQNIYQAMTINGNGQLQPGRWNDLDGTVTQALKGASWKTDPAGIPQVLRPAWLAIEMGDFKAAGTLLKKGRAAKDPTIKEASDKLSATAMKAFDDAFTAVKQQETAGDKRAALQTMQQLSDRFTGYDLPAEFADLHKKLASDPKVKAELLAATQLEQAKKAMASNSDFAKKRAITILRKIVADHPDSELAKEAQTLLPAGK